MDNLKEVYVNEDGYVMSPYFNDCQIKLEISEEEFKKYDGFGCLIGYNWKYDFITKQFSKVLIQTDDNLKAIRQFQCFSLIDNRSQMWYNHLTSEQKAELETWYQAWLDVTETKIIPEKPEWLN